MKQGIFKIVKKVSLAPNVFRMELSGDASGISAPGQFINIKIDGLYLRRPISVFDYDDKSVTVIYKVVGAGTEIMSKMSEGQTLDILSGLGNGYNTDLSGKHPLLIGGGVGIPPLYNLAKKLLSEGKKVSVILGFNSSSEIFCEEEFKNLGADTFVTTVDGSYGIKGFVTSAMDTDYSYYYACGPEPMLKAVYEKASTEGQMSFEERMGCGFGACMGCTCKTVTGYKRICKEGPVLRSEEIIWKK